MTLSRLESLALTHVQRDEFLEAEDLFLRILEGRERAFDREHPSAATIVDVSGILFLDRCRVEASNGNKGVENNTEAEPGNVSHLPAPDPIFRLILLAEKYGQAFESLFGVLAKALVIMSDETNATIAMKYELFVTAHVSNKVGIVCDHCHSFITPETEWYACKACEGNDLCRACFQSWLSHDWQSLLCQNHDFFQVCSLESSPSGGLGGSASWLQSLKIKYNAGGPGVQLLV